MNLIEGLKQWTLIAGLGDWVSLIDTADRTGNLHVPDDQLLETVCRVVSELADAELVEIGSVTREGFVPWSSTLNESIARIRDRYIASDRLNWGYSAWLRSLPKGIEAGESILAEGSEYSHLWQED